MKAYIKAAKRLLSVLIAFMLLVSMTTVGFAYSPDLGIKSEVQPEEEVLQTPSDGTEIEAPEEEAPEEEETPSCVCERLCGGEGNPDCPVCATDPALCEGALTLAIMMSRQSVIYGLFTVNGQFFLCDNNGEVLWEGEMDPGAIEHLIIDQDVKKLSRANFEGKLSASGLKSVTLNNVEELTDNVFSGYSGLSNVNFGGRLTKIGDGCFQNTVLSGSLDLPSSLRSIGANAFRGTKITSVKLGNNITSVGESAFRICADLTSVDIGNGLTAINNNVFYSCSNLKSITIPDNIKTIGSSAFYDCQRLETVRFGRNLQTIGGSAFRNCIDLKEAILPGSLEVINAQAFDNCLSLTKVILPNGLKTLGNFAFASSNISSITIPSSLTAMGTNLFNACHALTNVVIADGLSALGTSMFFGCNALSTVVFMGDKPDNISTTAPSGTNTVFRRTDGESIHMYYYSAKNWGGTPAHIDGHPCYAIDVENIINHGNIYLSDGSYSFIPAGLSGRVPYAAEPGISVDSTNGEITIDPLEIELGENHVIIKDSESINFDVSFSVYESFLESLIVTGASEPLFLRPEGGYHCYIPDEHTPVSVSAKLRSGFTDLTIDDSDFSNGKKITIKANYGANEHTCVITFEVDPSADVPVYALYDGMGLYKYDPALDTIGDEISGGDRYPATHIYFKADVPNNFANTHSTHLDFSFLEHVILLQGVEKVGSSAFKNTRILKVNFGSISTIGEGAFAGTKLMSVNLSNTNVGELPDACFLGCEDLTDVVLGGITSIGASVFEGCGGLKNIILPGGLAGIGDYAFKDTGLSELSLPSNIGSLGQGVFSGTSIKTLRIPAALTDVDPKAFAGSRITSLGFVGNFMPGLNDLDGSIAFFVREATLDDWKSQYVSKENIYPYETKKIAVYLDGNEIQPPFDGLPPVIPGAQYPGQRVTLKADGYMPDIYLSNTADIPGMMIYGGALGGKPLHFHAPGALTVRAYNDISDTDMELTLRRIESDATLKSLSVEGAVLSPEFDLSHMEYSATVEGDVTRITILAEANGKNAKITGIGEQSFPETVNQRTFEVVVTAEDGTNNTYSVEVHRRLRSVNLKSLTASNATLTKTSETVYRATVPGRISSTALTAIPEDPLSVVTGDGPKTLAYGANEFRITVKNTAGDEQIYTVVIIRQKDENRLSTLMAEDVILGPAFDPDTEIYRATVPYTLESTVIRATPLDANALASGDLGVVPLSVGVNRFTIIVMAEDGTRRTYTLEITRESSPVPTQTPAPTPTQTPTQTPSQTPTPEPTETPEPEADPDIFVILTPLTEGIERIALLVKRDAKVTMTVNGTTETVEADKYGYALFAVDGLEAERTVKFRVKETGGHVITRYETIKVQKDNQTRVRAYPASGLKASFDENDVCHAMPLNKLTAERFDADGMLTLPLLVGGVYDIGEVTILRDAYGALLVGYTLSDAFADAEIISETLRIYDELPGDAKLLQKKSEPLDEPIAATWEKPLWLKLELELRLDADKLAENVLDYEAADPADPRVDTIMKYQRELHGR